MKYLALLLLMGCPYMGEERYQSEIQDFDGDGAIAERFGGPDCRDDDPSIKNCDDDGDGFRSTEVGGTDCDDKNGDVNPEATEQCNQIDDDCDGAIDDADPSLEAAPAWFADDDKDGYGDANEVVYACEAPTHYIDDDRDCDDNNFEVYPGAVEFCDELDRDCDGDPIAGAVDPLDWYTDADGDGFGAGASVALACEGPSGTSQSNTDCNDAESSAYPGAVETWYDGIDSDCAGDSDFDQDGDGFDTPLDCNDTNADINPDATEICDGGVDNDCNGVAGNDDPNTSSVGQWIYYLDADGDGEGNDATATGYCPNSAPAGWTLISGDCDDTLDTVNSGGVEVCDDRDNDCDGVVDDNAIGMVDFFVDGDGDGYGGATIQSACDVGPGLTQAGGDCNDADPQTYPGAPELCGDLFRQDCTALSVYDCDSDGFADEASGGTDCDDTRDDVYPGANEVCDGVDNNCVDGIDDDDPAVDLSTVADWFLDDDGDGFGGPFLFLQNACAPVPGAATNSDDCDDTDPLTYPDALELCDGLDNSCDGLIDEDPLLSPPTYYFDADGDGFGNPSLQFSQDCDPPGPEWVANGDDCRDDDPDVNPLATEVCDGRDNDCDGDTDMDDTSVSATLWYLDDDGDGYGQSTVAIAQCDQPLGYAAVAGDCNDFEPTTNPGATEVCDGGIDNDCDGLGDDADPDLAAAVTWYLDGDNDGYGDPMQSQVQCTQPPGWVNDDNDCDDTQASVSPAAVELCDGLDNDCDGLTDDDDPTVVGAPSWFADSDGDSWGDAGSLVRACTQPPGTTPSSGDCDDSRGDISPGATEVCDGQDNDCDALVDDLDPNVVATLWYEDADGDSYGTPLSFQAQCPSPGPGWVADDSDCDDTDANIRPGASEVCNYIDDDCDNRVDDDDPDTTGQTTWYADADADGYGDPAVTLVQCGLPPGFVLNSGDCDDTLPQVNPSTPVEFCNGYDDNCDGLVDDDDPSADGSLTYFMDLDGDSYGDPLNSGNACNLPADAVLNDQDCNDFDATHNPAADEVCDGSGIDENCNGLANSDDPTLTDGVPAYVDLDGDGVSAMQSAIQVCGTAPPGYSTAVGDCNDADDTTFPGATERCDGIDNDCNGLDDDAPADPNVFVDADGDGYGGLTPGLDCPDGTNGVVFGSGDCDDLDPNRNPGANEICDGIDNNCADGADDADPNVQAPTWYFDFDVDGYGEPFTTQVQCNAPAANWSSNDQDCNDFDSLVNPGALELCDGFDNDCDGLVDDDDDSVEGDLISIDADGDSVGGGLFATRQYCSGPLPAGFGNGVNDCDDTNPNTFPGVDELCDLEDNDCNGLVDDNPQDPNVFRDTDFDGYGSTLTAIGDCPDGLNGFAFNNLDCDDTDSAINPGQVEICDSFDNDCDGLFDDQDSGVVGQTLWWQDMDFDNYGDNVFSPTLACSPPFGNPWTNQGGDCNDNDDTINPGELEVCDGGIDNDCNGVADDSDPLVMGQSRWYFDNDGDTYGDSALFTDSCTQPPLYRPDPGDCDDTTTAVNPGAAEICDGLDNNCNGLADDNDPTLDLFGGTTALFYPDVDGDGFTDNTVGTLRCAPSTTEVPPLLAQTTNDCDDFNATIFPGQFEVCDGQDNNCDGNFDETTAIDAITTYPDVDGDGYGDSSATPIKTCFPGVNTTTNNLDCNDTNFGVAPGAAETCDAIDNDCDGLIDDADPSLLGDVLYYLDADGDGFGSGPLLQACTLPGSNASLDGGDCDDFDGGVFPTATLDVPADHATIQGAIDALVCTSPGGTDIYVAPGTYIESLNLSDKYVRLIGDGASRPILVGEITTGTQQPAGTSIVNMDIAPTSTGGTHVIYVTGNATNGGSLTLQNVSLTPPVLRSGFSVEANASLVTENFTFNGNNDSNGVQLSAGASWDSSGDVFGYAVLGGNQHVVINQGGTVNIDNLTVTDADGLYTNFGVDGSFLTLTNSRVDARAPTRQFNAVSAFQSVAGGTSSVTISDTEFHNYDEFLNFEADNGVFELSRVELYTGVAQQFTTSVPAIDVRAAADFSMRQSIVAIWGEPATDLGSNDISIDSATNVTLTQNTWVSQGQSGLNPRGGVSITNFSGNATVTGNVLYTTDGTDVLTVSGTGPQVVDFNAFSSTSEQAFWGGNNEGGAINFVSYGNDLPLILDRPDLHILGPVGTVRDNPNLGFSDRDGTDGNLGADGGTDGIGDPDYYNDTDGDGMLDGWERVFFGDTSPLGAEDPDADSWDHLTESQFGTDPLSADTDGDGIQDPADADPLDASVQ